MITIGYDKTLNKRVFVDDADENSEIVCECCGGPLVAKRGEIKIHHFAHRNECDCHSDDYAPMSEWHKSWQEKFPIECREVWSPDKRHRADILIEELKLVIEFQHSHIDINRFKTRTQAWNDRGYTVAWVWHGELCNSTDMYHYMWDYDHKKNEFHEDYTYRRSSEELRRGAIGVGLRAGGSVIVQSYFDLLRDRDFTLLEFASARCKVLVDLLIYMMEFNRDRYEGLNKMCHELDMKNNKLLEKIKAYEDQNNQFKQLYAEFQRTKVFSNANFDSSFAHTLDELFNIHDFDFIVAMDCSSEECVTYLIDAKNENGLYIGHVVTDDGAALSRGCTLDGDEERWAFISGHKNKAGYNQLHLRLCYLYALQKKFFDD